MTPLDLLVKEYMRQFMQNRLKLEKQRTANMATGFAIREPELETFIDDMWVFINRKILDQKNESPK